MCYFFAKEQGVDVDRELAWLYLEMGRVERAIPLLQEEAACGSQQARWMLIELKRNKGRVPEEWLRRE